MPVSVSRDRVEQRILEEAARLPQGSLVSGWAALRLHRVNFCDGLDPDLRALPIPVVLAPHANAHPIGIVRHRAQVPAAERTICFGIACTTAERALFDAMTWAPDAREAVVVADMAFAAGATQKSNFIRYVAGRCGAKGTAMVTTTLSLTGERSLSPMETRMRLIWVCDADLPRPRCNWPVGDPIGTRIGRPDLLCEELAVVGEYDGAEHRGIEVHSTDVSKEEAYREVGLECFRIVGSDIHDVRLVVRRMRAAVRRAREADRLRQWTIRQDPGPL